MKFDQGKLRYDLLPVEPIEEIVRVLTFGAEKYAPNSWQGVPDGENRYYAAAWRHILAWRKGERDDPESGIHHLGHAMCNLVFLMGLEELKGSDNETHTTQGGGTPDEREPATQASEAEPDRQ